MDLARSYGICAWESIEAIVDASVFLDDDDHMLDRVSRNRGELNCDRYDGKHAYVPPRL